MTHAMRNAREGHSVTYLQSKEVPAGIHVRHAVVGYGAETAGAVAKPGQRTESTSDRPSNRLGELSRLATGPKLRSTSKCAKWLFLRAENRFLSRAPLRPNEGRVEGTRARQIPVLDLPGSRWGLSDSRTKKGPLSSRRAVQYVYCNKQ